MALDEHGHKLSPQNINYGIKLRKVVAKCICKKIPGTLIRAYWFYSIFKLINSKQTITASLPQYIIHPSNGKLNCHNVSYNLYNTI